MTMDMLYVLLWREVRVLSTTIWPPSLVPKCLTIKSTQYQYCEFYESDLSTQMIKLHARHDCIGIFTSPPDLWCTRLKLHSLKKSPSSHKVSTYATECSAQISWLILHVRYITPPAMCILHYLGCWTIKAAHRVIILLKECMRLHWTILIWSTHHGKSQPPVQTHFCTKCRNSDAGSVVAPNPMYQASVVVRVWKQHHRVLKKWTYFVLFGNESSCMHMHLRRQSAST